MISFAQILAAQWSDTIPSQNVQFQVRIHLTLFHFNTFTSASTLTQWATLGTRWSAHGPTTHLLQPWGTWWHPPPSGQPLHPLCPSRHHHTPPTDVSIGGTTNFWDDLPGVLRNYEPRPRNGCFQQGEQEVFEFVCAGAWQWHSKHSTLFGGWVLVGFAMFWVVGVKEKEVNRLCDAIEPYHTENLWPYIMQPPIQSHHDWGQSQFQLGGDDESAHQILSYFWLSIIFLTPQILWHAPHWHNLPCNSHDHHQLYPILIAPSAWHHVVDLPYDLWTTLFYFPS